MRNRMILLGVVGVLLVGCADKKPPPPPPPTVPPQSIPETDPEPAERVWVFSFAKQGGRPEFYDRIALKNSVFTSRDGVARGFNPAQYSPKEGEGFAVEQRSPTEGMRKWNCFGPEPLTCTLEWHRDHEVETYFGDDHTAIADPFRGDWSITLTPDEPGQPQLTGTAHFDRGALDLTISGRRFETLVYHVRPPDSRTQVDFFTVPPGSPGVVDWNGVLEANGRLVGWGEGEGNYSLGGMLTLYDPSGTTTRYQVSSLPTPRTLE